MPKSQDKKPADQDEQRSPEEASALARDVMKRMMQSPPKPHEQIVKRPSKKTKSTKRGNTR
jgi:hypothetical protein